VEVFFSGAPLFTCEVDSVEKAIKNSVWRTPMKILIIEDDENMVDYIKNVFNVGWPEADFISAYKGKEGVNLVEKEMPDVVLLDLGLPDMSGFDVLKQIRHFTEMTIVMITVRDDESDIVKGLSLGADEYIVKPFRQLELLARVRALTRRRISLSEDLSVEYGPLKFGRSIRDLIYKDREVNVTLTEGRILHKLIESKGNVVTSDEIAKLIWGERFYSAINVKSYIHRIRQKLEDDPANPSLIVNEPGVGYFIKLQD
jgi:DNA-binding response OmpR family regulator